MGKRAKATAGRVYTPAVLLPVPPPGLAADEADLLRKLVTALYYRLPRADAVTIHVRKRGDDVPTVTVLTTGCADGNLIEGRTVYTVAPAEGGDDA